MIEKTALTGTAQPALGAGGPRFKSARPDHLLLCFRFTLLASKAELSPFGPQYEPHDSGHSLTTLEERPVWAMLDKDLNTN